MDNRNYRITALLFSLASILFFILILIYVFIYQPRSGQMKVKIEYMNDNWTLISSIWSLEFIMVVVIAWVSINLSTITKWWNLVAIGHLFMLVEYMLLLGGYPNIASEETYQLINSMAVWVFASSNAIWLFGMAGVYLNEVGWIKNVGLTLSLIGGVIFLAITFGFATMNDLIYIAPVVNLLYLLNGYYGIKILRNKTSMAQ